MEKFSVYIVFTNILPLKWSYIYKGQFSVICCFEYVANSLILYNILCLLSACCACVGLLRYLCIVCSVLLWLPILFSLNSSLNAHSDGPAGPEVLILVRFFIILEKSLVRTLRILARVSSVARQCDMSQCMRFPTMWYARPAKPQISLRIRAVWTEPLLVARIFYDC